MIKDPQVSKQFHIPNSALRTQKMVGARRLARPRLPDSESGGSALPREPRAGKMGLICRSARDTPGLAKRVGGYGKFRIILQGLPAARTSFGTSRVTTLPAPITVRNGRLLARNQIDCLCLLGRAKSAIPVCWPCIFEVETLGYCRMSLRDRCHKRHLKS